MLTQSLVAGWRDYYLLACTIGATLLGLLFVAVSVNAEVILSGEHDDLKYLAQQAYQTYMAVVLLGLLFLFPNWGWYQASELFGVLGASGLAWSTYRVVRIFPAARKRFGRTRTLRRMAFPVAAFGMMVASGWWMQNQVVVTPLMLVGIAVVVLLSSATATSWDLLVQVGQLRHPQRPS